MKWHRNPFFHTAVLPPSAAPSALPSARPSADLDAVVAAASAAAAAATTSTTSNRNSTSSFRQSLDYPAPAHPYPQHHHQHQHSPHNGLLAQAAHRAALATTGGRVHQRRKPPVPKLTIREPSDRLTAYQIFYIFFLDGLGAFVLSGGINFAIACAMYRTQDTVRHPIRLFQFPNTLIGDFTVTVMLQTVITWFIELLLVNRDLRTGHIQPIGFIPEPSVPLLRWFLLLDRLPESSSASASPSPCSSSPDDSPGDSPDDPPAQAASASPLRPGTGSRPLTAPHDESCRCDQPVEEQYAPGSLTHWVYFLISQLLRALILGVLSFVVLVGPTVGILIGVGTRGADGDWWFRAPTWAPEIFKLLLGGVLALLTTPFFAGFWLVRCGWALRANERHLRAAEDGQAETV